MARELGVDRRPRNPISSSAAAEIADIKIKIQPSTSFAVGSS
jgi:hypothetical protein